MKDAGSSAACPLLTADTTADIVIIGGGFVGLWTAITIKERRPECDVVVLERHSCGSGASGRNGGFVMSWWPKIGTLCAISSKEQALFLARAAEASIGEIRDFCQSEGIDADFRQGGWLWTATTQMHLDSWKETLASCAALGVQPFKVLSGKEVAKRTGSSVHLAGVFEASNATVQPAKLVNGLKAAAIKRGVRIYENTAVVNFSDTNPCIVQTPRGTIRTNSLVIATNAWAGSIPELSPLITAVTSTIAATQQIPEKLRKIGWTDGESITDSQLMVNYYRTSRDGRIAFGKGTAKPAYGGQIGPTFGDDQECNTMVTEEFKKTYPEIKDTPIEHFWSGPIDRTYDSLPIFGSLKGTSHIHYGIGWSGNGVGPSKVGAKILASLALGVQDEWSTCALVHRAAKKFPPEPIRFVGAHIVRSAVIRKERAEMHGEKPSFVDRSIAKLAPSGLEDKS